MGKALYRKYRSKKLSEIVGQEHITRTLEQALKQDRISHAYLFTGPRGVGKTSIARILAHEINHLPYTDDTSHIDIIEIDAASNNGVEDVRDLRDKVYVAPALAKYKVYIIDEVHMLSRQAFNALLKTLEEPPAHVVFILATTEAHKLPETIVSRTQRYTFKPIPTEQIVSHLKTIAKQEKINADDYALKLIAEHGEGSFRDSISLLDQASSHGNKLDLGSVQAMLGIPPDNALESLLQAIEDQTPAANIVAVVGTLYDQGFQAAAIAKQLSAKLRTQIIDQSLPINLSEATALLTKLLDVPTARDPERYLEIVLLELAAKRPNITRAASTGGPVSTTKTSKTPPKLRTKPANTQNTAQEPEPRKAGTPEENPAATASTTSVNVLDESSWAQVLANLKHKYNTLYGLARMAKVDFSRPGKLELTFAFQFHQKRLREAKNLQIISDAVTEVTGQTVEIICSHDPELKSKNTTRTTSEPPHSETTTPVATQDPTPISTISNIFGGGELLES